MGNLILMLSWHQVTGRVSSECSSHVVKRLILDYCFISYVSKWHESLSSFLSMIKKQMDKTTWIRVGEKWNAKRKFVTERDSIKITWFSLFHFLLKFSKIENNEQYIDSNSWRRNSPRKTDSWLVCKSVEQLFSDRIWTWKCINSYPLTQWELWLTENHLRISVCPSECPEFLESS